MKNSLFILVGAAALSLASCSQEKPADTTTTTPNEGAVVSTADVEARAQRIVDKMAADMKITDEAMKAKIRTVYVNRYQQLGAMKTKYATDTTGMAAAMREATTATDAEFKTIFTDPTQYHAYESGRSTYYEMENETPSVSGASDMPAEGNAPTADASGSEGTAGGNTGAMSGSDGSKVKVKADGDLKIKDAEGNKVKVDGDDGTVKMKPKDGEKMKVE